MADPTTQAAWLALLILTQTGLGGGKLAIGPRLGSGSWGLGEAESAAPAATPQSLVAVWVVANNPLRDARRFFAVFALDGDRPGHLNRAAGDFLECAGH